ncbi:MAG: acyl-CoA dehydrogenase family protein [Nocardioidaceae bacterium]
MSGPPRLGAHVVADDVRSGPDRMRAALRAVVAEGRGVWTGEFCDVVEALYDVARIDLALARLVEGHADAMRVLDEAGVPPRDGVYGVWASRSVGTGVRATREQGGWRLAGELRFASGSGLLDRALVPGWLSPDEHLLFDVDAACLDPDPGSWRTPAMDASRSFSGGVAATCAAEDVVGPASFYLSRPGFVVGGLGVAAVWAGGVRAVVELVADGLRAFHPSPHQLRRLGEMEQAAWQARTAVLAVADRLSGLTTAGLAREVAQARTAAARACDEVILQATHVVGPGGLSRNARLARTLADLTVYVRQHHLDTELAALGEHALHAHDLTGA